MKPKLYNRMQKRVPLVGCHLKNTNDYVCVNTEEFSILNFVVVALFLSFASFAFHIQMISVGCLCARVCAVVFECRWRWHLLINSSYSFISFHLFDCIFSRIPPYSPSRLCWDILLLDMRLAWNRSRDSHALQSSHVFCSQFYYSILFISFDGDKLWRLVFLMNLRKERNGDNVALALSIQLVVCLVFSHAHQYDTFSKSILFFIRLN